MQLTAIGAQSAPHTESVSTKSLTREPQPLPPAFLDFRGLLGAVPLGERTLREEIKRKRIPAIRLPGGRRLLFHLPSVQKALLRFQEGGIAE